MEKTTSDSAKPLEVGIPSSRCEPMGFRGTLFNLSSIFRKQWVGFLLTQAVATLVIQLLTFGVLFFVPAKEEYTNTDNLSSTIAWWPCLALEFLIVNAIQCIADGTSIRLAMEVYVGHKAQLRLCFLATLDKLFYGGLFSAWFAVQLLLFCPLITLMVVMIAVLLGASGTDLSADDAMAPSAIFLILFIFFTMIALYVLFVVVSTFVAYPIVIVEGHGGFQSVYQSFTMTRRNFFHVFRLILRWWGFRFAVNMLVTSLVNSDNAGVYEGENSGVAVDLTFGGALDGILSIIVATIFAVVGSILQAVVYLDLRGQTEGYTMEILRDQLGIGSEEDSEYKNMSEVPVVAAGTMA